MTLAPIESEPGRLRRFTATWAYRARVAAAAAGLVSALAFAYVAGHSAWFALRNGRVRTDGLRETPPAAGNFRPLAPDEDAPPTSRPETIRPTLTAGPPTGGAVVQVLVDPPGVSGARVMLGGAMLGRTPWAGDVPCEPGTTVPLRIEAAGFETFVGNMQCTPGEPRQLTPRLRRLRF